MGVLTRLYDFVAGSKIQSDQVDNEFNQIVNALSGISTTKNIYILVNDAVSPALKVSNSSGGGGIDIHRGATRAIEMDPASQTKIVLVGNTSARIEIGDSVDAYALKWQSGELSIQRVSDAEQAIVFASVDNRMRLPQLYVNDATSEFISAQNDNALLRHAVAQYRWDNSIIAGLSGTSDTLIVTSLPAKTILLRAFIVITGQAAGPTTVAATLGTNATNYDNMLASASLKVAANTIYGNASAERGTANGSGDGFISYNTETDLILKVTSSGGNLSTVTGSGGMIFLEYIILPLEEPT